MKQVFNNVNCTNITNKNKMCIMKKLLLIFFILFICCDGDRFVGLVTDYQFNGNVNVGEAICITIFTDSGFKGSYLLVCNSISIGDSVFNGPVGITLRRNNNTTLKIK